jgi:hypothetical protein
MNINLHIERLILDGLPLDSAQGVHVRAAVEAELARLLSEQGLAGALQAGGLVPAVPAAPIQFVQGGSPAQIGTQIAQSVYSSIGNQK